MGAKINSHICNIECLQVFIKLSNMATKETIYYKQGQRLRGTGGWSPQI